MDILERLLQALEPIYLAQTYKLELQKGLQHSDDHVKVLALTQVRWVFLRKCALLCPQLHLIICSWHYLSQKIRQRLERYLGFINI